jgi:hypothetical protein
MRNRIFGDQPSRGDLESNCFAIDPLGGLAGLCTGRARLTGLALGKFAGRGGDSAAAQERHLP